MKRQWKLCRRVKEYPGGQKRWEKAYLLLMEIGHSSEANQTRTSPEVQYANSDLCAGVDPAPGISADD